MRQKPWHGSCGAQWQTQEREAGTMARGDGYVAAPDPLPSMSAEGEWIEPYERGCNGDETGDGGGGGGKKGRGSRQSQVWAAILLGDREERRRYGGRGARTRVLLSHRQDGWRSRPAKTRVYFLL